MGVSSSHELKPQPGGPPYYPPAPVPYGSAPIPPPYHPGMGAPPYAPGMPVAPPPPPQYAMPPGSVPIMPPPGSYAGGPIPPPTNPAAARGGRPLGRAASFRTFSDVYRDLPSLQNDLRRAGLESSNLIVGIDFTKSNEWTGKYSFGNKCLHTLDPTGATVNPYESSIMIIGQTLSAFDDDQLIPAYGFGSANTNDHSVFSLLPGDRPCNTFAEVLAAYRNVAPVVRLAGPTSFSPIIRQAINIVRAAGNQYHILLIICDGQVTRSSDLEAHEVSPQERETIDALVEASYYPLSIVCVGVGDGEDGWKTMKEFDDRLPERAFDNFQFVALNESLENARRAAANAGAGVDARAAMEATFALNALMEIPEQFRAITGLRMLGARSTRPPPHVRVFDPPALPAHAAPLAYTGGSSAPHSAAATPAGAAPPLVWDAVAKPGASSSSAAPPSAPAPASVAGASEDDERLRRQLRSMEEERQCSVCLERQKNTVFQCGHQTCDVCALSLHTCPLCRATIVNRIRLY